VIQLRDRGRWRRVGSTRVRGKGQIRFRRWTKLRVTSARPRARALVRGVGRSRSVRITVRG